MHFELEFALRCYLSIGKNLENAHHRIGVRQTTFNKTGVKKINENNKVSSLAQSVAERCDLCGRGVTRLTDLMLVLDDFYDRWHQVSNQCGNQVDFTRLYPLAEIEWGNHARLFSMRDCWPPPKNLYQLIFG